MESPSSLSLLWLPLLNSTRTIQGWKLQHIFSRDTVAFFKLLLLFASLTDIQLFSPHLVVIPYVWLLFLHLYKVRCCLCYIISESNAGSQQNDDYSITIALSQQADIGCQPLPVTTDAILIPNKDFLCILHQALILSMGEFIHMLHANFLYHTVKY